MICIVSNYCFSYCKNMCQDAVDGPKIPYLSLKVRMKTNREIELIGHKFESFLCKDTHHRMRRD